MKNISELYEREQHPVKFLQIGEGNFLRAFVDYAIDVANEENDFDANVAVLMPRAKKMSVLLGKIIFIRWHCAVKKQVSSIKKTES